MSTSDRKEWKPNPKQATFLSIPWSIKEALFGGGAGSGKSDVLLMYGIVHQLHLNPRFKQVFLRRTHTELKKEIVPRSRDIYPQFGASLNMSDMVWTFPREDQFGSGYKNAGASIFLGHCENEKDVHNYDSMEINLFTPDEITSLTEYIYLYIAFERGRAPRDSGLPSVTRAAGMPSGVGHTFTYNRFVKPHPDGSKVLVGRGGNKRIFIHATYIDNPHVDPTYGQSLDGRPDAERKAKKFGDWTAYLGQVFDEFRDKKYADEPDNALHVIPSFEIPHWWPKVIVGDWGMRAMCWIGFAAISPTGRVYIYRELTFQNVKIEHWAPTLKYFIAKEEPKIVKFCRSASQDRGTEHTVQSQIESAIGISIDLANGNPGTRIPGKQLVHEYLRWKPKPIIPFEEKPLYSEERAAWILRNKGLEDYKAYHRLFDQEIEETNIPKLQIFCCDKDNHEECTNCCPHLVQAIKACSYDTPKDDKPAEDVKQFDGDDPYDGLRYILDTIDRYFDESKDEFAIIQRQNALVAKLQNDKDFTAFYRQMRASESNEGIQPVKRFHKGR